MTVEYTDDTTRVTLTANSVTDLREELEGDLSIWTKAEQLETGSLLVKKNALAEDFGSDVYLAHAAGILLGLQIADDLGV